MNVFVLTRARLGPKRTRAAASRAGHEKRSESEDGREKGGERKGDRQRKVPLGSRRDRERNMTKNKTKEKVSMMEKGIWGEPRVAKKETNDRKDGIEWRRGKRGGKNRIQKSTGKGACCEQGRLRGTLVTGHS